jgi:flagellar FliJ protein
MGWRESLVRLADYEVEQLQLRLAEVVERRTAAQMKLVMLHAEAQAESARAATDAEAGWYRVGYLQGWRLRRDAAQADLAAVEAEEAGVRDALAQAFEELKKYEQLRENAALAERQVQARLETALMDELGARRRAGSK